jgi:hypothetical protein
MGLGFLHCKSRVMPEERDVTLHKALTEIVLFIFPLGIQWVVGK